MMLKKQFRCFLIGAGTLPIQCAELLLERGHQVLGIVSPDQSISDWAKEKEISHISPKDDIKAFFSQQPFDYLFSIVNGTVLPQKILELPRQGAINYNDAPFPKYAGVNVTSWALMQQEKTHGVSWHRMSEVIDGGDILKQVSLNIAKGETAFTLNGKCYEAAIHSFAQLIDELSSGKAVTVKQNLNERTYFPPSKRPSSGGLLSFNRCAYELDALVRALDFGPYPNPLGLAKLAIERDFIVVSQLEVLDEFSQASPGTITGIETDFLKVSTSSYEIVLRELQTLESKPLSIPDLVKRFGLQVGYRFQDIDLELAKRIEKFDSLIAKHEAFWVERLASLQPLAIPYAERSLSPSKQKRYASVKMPVLDEVITFLEERHPTWNSGDFLLAAFVGYLARIGDTACFDIGFRDVGLARELNGSTGFFAAYVPCHLEINLEQSFEEFFETVREQVALTKQHKTYARDAVVRYPELRSVPDLGSVHIFPVVIERVEKLDDHQASPGNELTFIISEDGKECGWFYNAGALDGDSVARMVEQFTIFLQGIVTDSSQHLAYLPLLSEEERHKILVEWNDTKADYPLDKCIHQLFEEQVERTPDNVAVVFENEKLTYRDLNARANQLAHYLQKLGVGPEVLVGICVERSPLMVIGLLGILKAGGAYVPLDPEYPKERLAFMLEDAQVSVLLTQRTLVEILPKCSAQVVYLDADEFAPKAGVNNPTNKAQANNLAYVLYTSGSTGTPKGVAIEHHSTIALLDWATGVFTREQLAGVLASTSFCFDISVFELFVPLSCGGKVILAENALHLATLPAARGVTLINTVPSAIAELVRAKGIPDGVRTVNLAGEALPQRVVELLYQQETIQEVLNLYGPSEDTVYSTYALVKRDSQKAPPIGRPIANTQTYILDAYQQPVPIGVPGELHLGGAGLARGYLNRPELTEEKFIPNPFNNPKSKIQNRKLYKTGDLVRYLPNGNIEFLGRIDHQVKVRGNRIELGEIESVLGQYPNVREVVVVAREDIPGDKRLLAYVVPNQEQSIASRELRHFLKDKLPDYMMPSAFVLLDKLPRTPNGKVNRRALPVPDNARPELEETFVAPQTPVEEVLAGIWAEVLGVDRVGVQDNFFELGGHSLLATQVISRVRDVFAVDLSLYSLFEAPTISSLGERIEAARREGLGLQAPPILPRTSNENLPLSFAQQRLWFLDQLEQGNSTYNIPVAYRLTGVLNIVALERSLKEIVQRHEVLRTIFPSVDGQPSQAFAPNIALTLPITDLREHPRPDREALAQQIATAEAQKLFNLATGPLFRAQLLHLAEADDVLLLNMHHIVSDGWSFNVFFQELTALYRAFSKGQSPPLPELSIQYADFAVWQRQWLQGEVLESQLDYWKQKLSGSLPVLELPIDYPRPSIQTYRGAYQSLVLSNNLMDALKSLGQEAGVTLFMTLLAAFQTLLSRYSGQEDIIVGTPIAGRNQLETEGLIGFFVNSLVLRTDLSGNPSFRELLNRVREVALGAYAHQDLPFEKLVEELQPERDRSRSPLFQVMFALQNTLSQPWELPGVTITPLEVHSGTSKFDLTLDLRETSEGIKGGIEYNTDLFKAETIARMLGHFQVLLEGIVSNPEQRLSDLPLLTLAEQHQLLVEWNNTQTDYLKNTCIHQLFEEQVARTPNAIAVVFEEEKLTYRELNCRANQLAHYLQKLGVKPEVLVGICLERSPLMLVALLAILKAGGAYVPLDPDYPQERLTFMLEDTQVPVLLTQQSLVEKLPTNQGQSLCLDTDWDKINCQNEDNPTCNATADNLAYVTYTSGSTGKPKGVCAIHRGVVRLVKGIDYVNLSSAETLLQLAPISFDASTFEIWGSLLNGARLALFPNHTPSLEQLGQAIRRYQVTTLWLTAGLFHLMVDERLEDLKPLRQLLAGGDVLSVSHVQKFLQAQGDCQLINGYGPTENTTFTCCYRILETSKLDNSVPIGRPISNTQIYILDSHLNPVPIGVPGELYIGGDGLARGYLNRHELTEEKFISNPFDKSKVKSQKSKLYKTGDLARYLSDGNIEFLGRIDNQVKIRGFRIELGEVEATLSQHPAIGQTVVIARDDISGDKRLVAYLVLSQDQALTVDEIRRFLEEKLPNYMIPSAFVFLETFPLTPNGKIDRRALPAPDQTRQEPEETFVAPGDELEGQLTKIWEKVLGIEPIGVKDNFFDLGGHSLLAVKLFAQIEKVFKANLPLASLFQAPTIEQLANILHSQRGSSSWDSLVPIQPRGSRPPLFCIPFESATALYYRQLARHLGWEQPFYGFQYQGMDEIQTPQTKIEEMAAHFIKEMQTVQPNGPYFLGGCRFGGMVAFEMAQQLHAQGQEVALLVLFDTHAPGYAKRLPFPSRLYRHLRHLLRLGPIYALEKVKGKSRWLKNRLKEARKKIAVNFYQENNSSSSYTIRYTRVKESNRQALRTYVPERYQGQITLFEFSRKLTSEGWDYDSQYGWGEIAADGVEHYVLPTAICTAFKEPEVQILAEKLKACIDKALEDDREGYD
ncbi:MAG: amino acid adenylation domain-containing protein [Microcystis aeruginosa K13-06]|nr:amino acid adenylation domain-containing protein [Microcystis aeruginosa K13-06]